MWARTGLWEPWVVTPRATWPSASLSDGEMQAVWLTSAVNSVHESRLQASKPFRFVQHWQQLAAQYAAHFAAVSSRRA